MRVMAMVVAATVLALASGCERRADYLEPQTNNKFLLNLGRAATVIMPLGMSANVLLSEMARDANALNRGEKLDTYGSKNCAE